jgi:hypothetical protein
MTENVRRKDCLWCGHQLARQHRFDRNTSRICVDCKEELKKLKIYLGRTEWIKMLEANGLEKNDVLENYDDYKNEKLIK